MLAQERVVALDELALANRGEYLSMRGVSGGLAVGPDPVPACGDGPAGHDGDLRAGGVQRGDLAYEVAHYLGAELCFAVGQQLGAELGDDAFAIELMVPEWKGGAHRAGVRSLVHWLAG